MEKVTTTYNIHVKLFFEQNVLLQWELDPFTADHLIAITNANAATVKYRLSLKCYFNATHNHYYSYLTKYDRGISEKIMFPCSEPYSTKMSSLRELESLDELSHMSSVALQQQDPPLHEEPMECERIAPIRFRSKWKPILSRVLVSTVVIALLSYFYVPEISYISEKVFANVIQVSSESPKQKIPEARTNTENTVELISNTSLATNTEADIQQAVLITKEPEITVTEPLAPPVVVMDKEVNSHVPSGSVALTFDDGPSLYTKDIVDVLKKYQVGGTFFFVGSQVHKFPESVKYVDDHGFSIGNHSMTHPNLTKLSTADQQFQIEQTNQLIQNITSKSVLLFRPPYGSRDDKLTKLLTDNNMKMVLWNNDPEDWNTNDSNLILNYIVQTKSPGSIILLHESKETLKALPFIIEFLQKQQLEISSLI